MGMPFEPPPRVRAILDRVLDDDDRARVDRPWGDVRRLYREYIRPQRLLVWAGVFATIVWSLLPMLFPVTWKWVTDEVLLLGHDDKKIDGAAAPALTPEAPENPAGFQEPPAPPAEGEGPGDEAAPSTPFTQPGERGLTAPPPMRERPRDARAWGVLWFLLMNTAIWLASVTLNWFRYRWLNVGGLRLLFSLRRDMHEKLLRLHVGFFDKMHSGQIMSRVIDDVGVIRDWSTHQLAFFAYCTAKLAFGPFLLFMYNWRIALAVLATLPIYAWCFKTIRPQLRLLNISMRRLYSRQYAHATERIGAIRVVKAFVREGPERTAFARLANDQVRLQMRQAWLNHLLAFAAGLLTTLTTVAVAFLGAMEYADGRMTAGTVIAVIGTLGHVFEPVNSLTGLMVQIQRFFVVLRRVYRIKDEPEQVPPGAAKLAPGMRGALAFDGVTFAYPGSARPALRDVSFAVAPGETVAVMGPSGAGKSTVFSLLLRFYDPQTGTVRVDGRDLRDVDPASLRARVVMVQQEPTVFSGTLAENLAYGHPDAQPRDLMRAAERAELHDFIMSLPLKYESEVGESGVSLSGGQKQRLALATALLTDPEVLLLDDTTSALDAETEQRIRTTLRKVLADRTSLMITQRIATARACDRILVFEDGVLTQQGTHDELRAADGFYRRVWLEQEGRAATDA